MDIGHVLQSCFEGSLRTLPEWHFDRWILESERKQGHPMTTWRRKVELELKLLRKNEEEGGNRVGSA